MSPNDSINQRLEDLNLKTPFEEYLRSMEEAELENKAVVDHLIDYMKQYLNLLEEELQST